MPPTPRKPPGLRGILASVAEESGTVEQIRRIVLEALQAEGMTLAKCPACGEEFRQQLPDVKKQLDAAIALLEQIEGKAETAKPEATRVIIQRLKLNE